MKKLDTFRFRIYINSFRNKIFYNTKMAIFSSIMKRSEIEKNKPISLFFEFKSAFWFPKYSTILKLPFKEAK